MAHNQYSLLTRSDLLGTRTPVCRGDRRSAMGIVPDAAADPAAHAGAGDRRAVGALPSVRRALSQGTRARRREPRAARDARCGRESRPSARSHVGRRHRVHAGRRLAPFRRQRNRDAREPLLRAAVDLSSRRGAVPRLNEFAGRRITVGLPGSGSRAFVLPLLAANGVTPDNATFIDAGSDEALQLLVAGRADIAMLVGGGAMDTIQRALQAPGVKLMSVPRAAAYVRRFPHITRLVLPAGTVDLARDIPPADVEMVSTEAMLVARDGLHPALVNLLLEVVRDVHDEQGYFEAAGEFPNTTQVDIPVSPAAVRHTPVRHELPLPDIPVLGRDVPRPDDHPRGAAAGRPACSSSISSRRSCAGVCGRAGFAGMGNWRCSNARLRHSGGRRRLRNGRPTSTGSSARSRGSSRACQYRERGLHVARARGPRAARYT